MIWVESNLPPKNPLLLQRFFLAISILVNTDTEHQAKGPRKPGTAATKWLPLTAGK